MKNPYFLYVIKSQKITELRSYQCITYSTYCHFIHVQFDNELKASIHYIVYIIKPAV